MVVGIIVYVGYSLHNYEPTVDVSKRLLSPDQTKLAFLLRGYDVSQVYSVSIVPLGEGVNWWWEFSDYDDAQRIFVRDYYFDGPPVSVNVDENIQWSADSSLLKLTITGPEYKPYAWAYGLVTALNYYKEDALQGKTTLQYMQLSDGSWFPFSVITEQYNIQTGEVIARHKFELDIDKSVFNDPSATPEDAFELKLGSNTNVTDLTSLKTRFKRFMKSL